MAGVCAGALPHLHSLETLHMVEFSVTDKGIVAITSALAAHQTALEELALVTCGVSTLRHMYAIQHALPAMRSLSSFILTAQQQEGLDPLSILFSALRELRNLIELNLKGHLAVHTNEQNLERMVTLAENRKLRRVLVTALPASAWYAARAANHVLYPWLTVQKL